MDYNREDGFSLDRLINRTNTAEGTSLPPQQRGPYRVPFVTGVRVNSPKPTKYSISWLDVTAGADSNIAQYNIFYQNSANPQAPVGILSVNKSPANFQLIAPFNSRLTFFVQTQLGNGFVNPAGSSPTATIIAA